MQILLTNDDGWDAPGLTALTEVARSLGDVFILAPDRHLSGCSHQTTTSQSLKLVERAPNLYHLNGTPADCVRVAIRMLHRHVDLVLSGINDGGNLGVDIFMSGTVAAAREAALMGIPSIAISQYRQCGHQVDWLRSQDWALRAIDSILTSEGEREFGQFWNINLPDAQVDRSPQLIQCRLEPHPLDVQYRQDGDDPSECQFVGTYQNRGQHAGSDVAVCFGGDIAITRVSLGESFHKMS
jgi:5'-nucleotidase